MSTPRSTPPGSSILCEATLEAVTALRKLLNSEEPKVVLSAVKLILEFEKTRLRYGLKYAGEVQDAELTEQPKRPTPAKPTTSSPTTTPVETPAKPTAQRSDSPAVPKSASKPDCPTATNGARLRGVGDPSISSFLPPRITGSSECPRPIPTLPL